MGYRSDVAILMYGDPKDCDVVCNLFTVSADVDQGLKDLFEHCKTEVIYSGVKYVMWQFADIKWYSDCDEAKAKLFNLVNAVEEEREAERNQSVHLAIEYARMGESEDDNERDNSDKHEWLLTIQRSFDYPDFLTNEGE